MKNAAPGIADELTQLRAWLAEHGDAAKAADVQRFFKEPVRSYGVSTAALRAFGKKTRKRLLPRGGAFLLDLAEALYRAPTLSERALGVFLLEGGVADYGDAEFARFAGWLDRADNWASHDCLVCGLLGPMIAAEPKRAEHCLRWLAARNRWRRRASAVALIEGSRKALLRRYVEAIAIILVGDDDEMVLKGVGWLLREVAKHDHDFGLALLRRLAPDANRLPLRVGCETLPAAERKSILSIPRV